MAMAQQGPGMWDYCGHHEHYQDLNGVLVTLQTCDGPDCSMRSIQEGEQYCGTCRNSKVIYVPCGCPPDPSVPVVDVYAQGSAAGDPSQDRRKDNGSSSSSSSGGGGGSGSGRGKHRHEGGSHGHRVGRT